MVAVWDIRNTSEYVFEQEATSGSGYVISFKRPLRTKDVRHSVSFYEISYTFLKRV